MYVRNSTLRRKRMVESPNRFFLFFQNDTDIYAL